MTDKINKIIQYIIPPPSWKLPVAILMGIFVGLIIYVLNISNAVSYLSDKPETCVNCHVMYPEYASWERGSHGRVAGCNDCHVPQDNIIRKYLFKASDGLRHASMFTFRLEPQVIRIKNAGRAVVQENCIRCHSNYLHPISLRSINAQSIYDGIDGVCWDCHRETPHGRVHSLASAQNIIKPEYKPVVSEWIFKNMNKK
ncbi:MAG: cytochrome c nitrite reductase small subunit [Ignavibacteriales bacterium]|nr:cytochrome c nitrite reductase small subunit [Ignavibacteriales bacterium]MBK7980811.1 cytochrome c nitrite reductase small subunit [Ignavibacteriota bacterium]